LRRGGERIKQVKPAGRLSPAKALMAVSLVLFMAVQIFPMAWLIDFSLASSNELFTSGILILPKTIRWDNYRVAFVDGHFLHYIKNSLLINSLAVLLVIVFSIMAAYALTRMKWKLNPVIRNMLLLGMMIPIHATLLPNFSIYDRLGITNTIWALLIPYVAFSLPQGLFLACGFMESLPRELEEAAVIDGCGLFRVVAVIVAPLMKPAVATIAIMTYLNNWNEFMMAMTYLSSPVWKTIPFSVLEFTGQYSSNYAIQFAVMALTAFPAVLIYVALNKHITKGVAMGAIKG
jgi:raffinose/stachyose/melibiose transport system permease protein